MTYELWDIESRSIVGAFDNEDAALAVVRQAVDEHGAGTAETLALVQEDIRGRITTLAVGSTLVTRAASRAPALATGSR